MSIQSPRFEADSSPYGTEPRILVLRLGAMGDILHTLPAVAALKRDLPGAHIGWVIESRWKFLLAAQNADLCGPLSPARPLVESVHVADTFRWRSSPLRISTARGVIEFVNALRQRQYHIAVDFQGAIKSSTIGALSRASVHYGFTCPRERAAGIFYTRAITAKGSHIIDQNLSLASAVSGHSSKTLEFPLPYDPAAEQQCAGELIRRGLQDFVMMNPGAGWGAKRWPAERYSDVARELYRQGLPSLINAGPGEESLAAEVAERSGGAAEVLACSLPQMVAFIRRARLFVGGDTGPLHLACALGIPVVAIFGPTDPARNGPRGGPRIVLRTPHAPISYSHHDRSDPGLLAIASTHVLSSAQDILNHPERYCD